VAVLELSRELMAAIALAVFWIHALLIAAAAGLELRELGRLARARVRAGVVASGAGPEAALARNVVAQIGRGKGDGVIHLSDASHRSEVFGGVIELDDAGERLTLAAGEDRPVWPDPEVRAQAAAAALDQPLRERALHEARRARGWSRSVEVALRPGDRVFVVDPIEPDHPGLISAIDPRRWLTRKRWLLVGFIVGELALASACTALAVWPPLFGPLSMLGAAAALGLFLAVQPVGVAVSDAVRTPDRAYLRGRV
jgi:hypothetical protein